MPPPKHGRRCWNCRQRKVACDRRGPPCQACSSSGRECLGYGLKLSWPRDGDKKRAIVLESDAQLSYSSVSGEFVRVSTIDIELYKNPHPRETEFLNISMFDMDMYYNFPNSASLALFLQDYSQQSIHRNPRWAAFPRKATEIDLLSYYQEKVAPRLTSASSAVIQDLIFRMYGYAPIQSHYVLDIDDASFTDTQPGSAGVLFAIYALASLHLSDSLSAQKYKSKAVTSIAASTSQPAHASLSLQQIVAFALLSMFETAALVHPLVEWTNDICCLRITGAATFALDRMYEGDESLVLEMATYHDFLTQFSTRHNLRRTKIMVEKVRSRHLSIAVLNSPRKTLIRPALACSIEVFCTLSSILDACWDIGEGGDPQNEELDKLERRLKYAKQELDASCCSGETAEDLSRIASIAELHRLCGLIYLYRVGRRVSSTHPNLQTLVSDAFKILHTVRTCDRTFPLFLLGCEAESDLQRVLILKISRWTEEEYFSTVMIRMREYIERFWALFDLDTDGTGSHTDRMAAAMSAQSSIPSFL